MGRRSPVTLELAREDNAVIPVRRGTVIEGILVKRNRQVQMFNRYQGFGVALEDLKQVDGVQLHYKGQILYASSKKFLEEGIAHEFKGEHQRILNIKKFEVIEDKQERLL